LGGDPLGPGEEGEPDSKERAKKGKGKKKRQRTSDGRNRERTSPQTGAVEKEVRKKSLTKEIEIRQNEKNFEFTQVTLGEEREDMKERKGSWRGVSIKGARIEYKESSELIIKQAVQGKKWVDKGGSLQS